MSKTDTRTGGTDLSGRGFQVRSVETKVLSTDEYSEEVKKQSETHRSYTLNGNEVASFLESREISVKLAVGAVRLDTVVLVELRRRNKEFNRELTKRFKVSVIRDENQAERFTIAVSEDKTSNEAWAYVKKYAESITLAYHDGEN